MYGRLDATGAAVRSCGKGSLNDKPVPTSAVRKVGFSRTGNLSATWTNMTLALGLPRSTGEMDCAVDTCVRPLLLVCRVCIGVFEY